MRAAVCSQLGPARDLFVEGRYQIKPPLPFVPGSEMAGGVGMAAIDVARHAGARVVALRALDTFGRLVIP